MRRKRRPRPAGIATGRPDARDASAETALSAARPQRRQLRDCKSAHIVATQARIDRPVDKPSIAPAVGIPLGIQMVGFDPLACGSDIIGRRLKYLCFLVWRHLTQFF